VRSPTNESIALRNLVTTKGEQGPVMMERKDRQRLVTVTANVSGRDPGSVAADVQARLHRIARRGAFAPASFSLSLSKVNRSPKAAMVRP